jgi:hypothetical protein
MEVHVVLSSRLLPFWFLVVALFLPRLALFLMWLQGSLIRFHLGALIPPILWLVLPRVLVLYVIYLDQGVSLWFLIHLVAAVIVWGGSGRYHARRRRRNEF